MKAHFEEMGYALKFEMNEYILSPVLFHNIYKGALGEVAGKFILKRELGIELSPITVPNILNSSIISYLMMCMLILRIGSLHMCRIETKSEKIY